MKVPVSDVRVSAEWYRRVLGLKVAIEFAEDGELRGVAMAAPGGATPIALPLGVPTRDGVQAWVDHLAEVGQEHGGIEIRLYAD